MEAQITIQEEQNRKRGQIAAGIGLLLLIGILLFPIFWKQNPPPGQPGILVNLGLPDVGMGNDNSAPAPAPVPEPNPQPQENTPPPTPQPDPVVEPTPEPQPAEPTPTPPREVVTTETPEQIRMRQQREREQEQARERQRQEDLQRQREQEAERQRQAEAERQRQAEAEAQRQAEAERQRREAEAAALRDQLGGGFGGGGSGSGNGNTNTPGDQGTPDGTPNADALSGISTGSGTVTGFGDRGIAARGPVPEENSQVSGNVVVRICVNADGRVTSADFTQRGSTTSDARLKAAAIRSARQYRFEGSLVDRQCGEITYRFRVQ
ncbi:MAG: TonB family protein [Bacteroidota bacterium]